MKYVWIFLVVMFVVMVLPACQPANPPSLPIPQDHQAEPVISEQAERDATETATVTFAHTQESEPQPDPALPIPALASLPRLIESAKEDLAQNLGTPVARINVREARDVFWADSSLGCPQPGITYSQIQTPGYLILLEYGGNEFEYHANIHNYVFYCENPTPPSLETPENVQP